MRRSVVFVFVLFLFCSKEVVQTKRSNFSHQATFEANWVCMSYGFAAGHEECVVMGVERPPVAAECNCSYTGWNLIFLVISMSS